MGRKGRERTRIVEGNLRTLRTQKLRKKMFLQRSRFLCLSSARSLRRGLTTLPVFKEKEMGEENAYFRREDTVLKQKLLKKLADKELREFLRVKTLIKPHKLPGDTLQKIVDWKLHD